MFGKKLLKLTLITIGKLKEKSMKALVDEYSKRLSAYCKLKIIELDDEKCPENLSNKEMQQVIDREGPRIESKIPQDAVVIPLVIDGKQLTSEAFANTLEDWQVSGVSHICFIIGGSLGLSQELQNRGRLRLSFSKMTFPHQLFRVMLLEQIYRSFRIMRNEPYHK